MPVWAILGLVGVGGYLLLSKSASASTASAQQAANQSYAQQLAANPSGLQPGYQGQATGPYTPYTPPAPAPTPTYPDPTQSGGGGGQVYDPNLGGTPDINSLLSGMQPGYQGAPGTTAAGMVGQQRRR